MDVRGTTIAKTFLIALSLYSYMGIEDTIRRFIFAALPQSSLLLRAEDVEMNTSMIVFMDRFVSTVRESGTCL
jgi:hypothetical protein